MIKKSFLVLMKKLISDLLFLKIKYFYRFRKKLNLDKPKTFNEKLQWLKLYDRTNLHTICADKIKVRQFVKDTIGEEYLIPLVGFFQNADEINPLELPNYPIIIKTNHDSGTYFIVKDKKKQDWAGIKNKLNVAIAFNYYISGREWQYKNIKPIVLIEKLLTTDEGSIPRDIKLHCFNGHVKFIQVDVDRESIHKRSLFDVNWNLLNFEIHYPSAGFLKPPTNLKLLIKLAEKIAKNFTFVRVDFYEVKDEIYFGEITFHPGSGFEKFKPDSKNLDFGKELKLN